MISINLYIDYLNTKLNRSMYVLSAQGQNIVNLLPEICDDEKSLDLVNNVLNLLYDRLKSGFKLEDLDAYDCSGLFMKFALEHGIFTVDMTANEIYKSIPDKVPLTEVQIGDFLFDGSDAKKTHVGYAIDHEYAIEARGTRYGVVKTRIKDRSWKYAARPYWWSDVPDYKPTLTRKLYYVEGNMMKGDDVALVQTSLKGFNCDCGKIDGVFGLKTDAAVKKFQTENGLNPSGKVGKKTAKKLGFKYDVK